MPKTIAKPEVVDVEQLVRRALYSRDPLTRAIASAELEALGLPVSPSAIILAARAANGSRP